MKKLTLSVVALTMTMMSYSQTQCDGLTKDSVQCKNNTKLTTELCYLHDSLYVKDDKVSQKCNGTTKVGKSCKNKTKNESGLCYRHEEN
tara:strand:- start:26 stop:292 length:267 start_codon:yes stop_codon:yes gene_type:complete